MRYKIPKIIILFIIILILSLYFTLYKMPKKEESIPLTDDLFSKLEMQQKASATMLERSWGNETLFRPINAIDGSKDEYVTYYVYQTASLLGHSPNKNYCQTLLQMLHKDSFPKEQENLIFSGIERVFRAQKSMELCQENAALLLRKHIKYLLNTTYNEQGFFLSEEFKKFKNKPEYMDVKIQQTYMMLYLASNYGFLEDIDTKKIKYWIDTIILEDFYRIDTVIKINKMLGYETEFEIDNNKVYQLVNLKSYNFNDLLELNSLTNINKFQNNFKLENKTISIILNKLDNYHFGLSDIQSEYYKLNILSNLNKSIKKQEKQLLLRDFSAYVYKDGMFPTISSFNNPFSPTFIGRDSVEYSKYKTTKYDKTIFKHIKQVDISELIKLDSLEVFSFVSLLKLIDGEEIEENKKEELKKALLKKVKEPIVRSNIMSWSFYTRSLQILEGDISKDMLPKNTEDILNQIVISQKSYFESNDNISTLVFLDTLARTGVYLNKIKKTEPFINKVNIDINSDIAAYLIYYKTSLLEELDLPYDKNKIANHVKNLFKNHGYALNNKESFPDIYSTYFMMNTNKLLMEDVQ
ncbi:hypothetical protein [Niallia sp. 01092]|uniref:hypothetical protein n=1 Tax=unclassified Niallia TaxID=2837522 RepID=UPI003FCFE9EE